jgi:hypothetical protein
MNKHKKNLKSPEFQRLYEILYEKGENLRKGSVSSVFVRETTRIPSKQEKEAKIE